MGHTPQPLCLVTGASAGIGAALATEFARNGWDLALTARREPAMEKLAKTLKAAYGTHSLILPADLSDMSENARLVKTINAKGYTVDGLVNNAGFGLPGEYIENDWDTHTRTLNLMLTGPSELAHLVLPDMKAQGFGRIINVASLAGHLPGSMGRTNYAAIKAFLIKFSQALNMEYSDHGIYVSALCPGFTFSEFHDVNGTRDAMNTTPKFMWESAARVAEEGYQACQANKAVYIPGKVNKALAMLGKTLPENAALGLMKWSSKKYKRG